MPPGLLPRPRSVSRTLTALVIAGLAGCADREDATGTASEPVVYGQDDREDVFAFADQEWAARANGFAAAMIPLSTIDLGDPDDVGLPPETLADFGVCPDERFADQLSAGFCSGTLIAPDLILTAGHCIDDDSCEDQAFVFDYSMTDATTLQTITAADVYPCADVVVNLVDDSDYAVVRLDREVVGRTPAPVSDSAVAMPANRRLLVNGYPSGLPLKIDDGARVRDARPDTLDFFVANLDTFGGNSGSGVFDNATELLVGILVRGETDYVTDPVDGCDRVNVCPNNGCSGEDSTYAFRAIEALCASGEPAAGLCPCGDGTCDAAGGETTATCPLDCGTECGDGTCNGDESPNSCTADCGTCGNGACDGDDTQESCCTDCGCAGEGDVCLENECVPDPGPGDTCELPLEIPAEGSQTITGDTLLAQNDFEGSCVGDDAPDRVYTFTLTGETVVDAVVGGYDTGMYLRSACDDDASEIACNDDIDFPENTGSQLTGTLAAGTYFLVVDGFGASSGAYTLTVSFDPTCPDGDEDGACDADDPCPEDPADRCDGDDGSDDGGEDDGSEDDGAADDGSAEDGAEGDGSEDDGAADDGSDDAGDRDDDDDRGRGGDEGCNAAGGGGGPGFGLLLLLAMAALRVRHWSDRGQAR